MGLFTRYSEFYDFTRGAQHWRHTSDVRDVVYQTQSYIATAGLKRSEIVLTQELEKAALQITVPWDFPLLDIYRPAPPLQKVTVGVYRLAKGATTAEAIWTGIVTDINDADESSATIQCAGGLAMLTNNGLHRKWQKGCPLVLYGTGLGQCNKPKSDVRLDGVITGSTGTTLQAAEWAGKPTGWFDGGFIEWSIGEVTDRRFIVSHVGNTLHLLTPVSLPVGAVIPAYPGCDHTDAGGCTKLNNNVNFGGQKYIPLKNPMTGDLIY
jgi:uncharacterized phage protein (TIGR02218 family)